MTRQPTLLRTTTHIWLRRTAIPVFIDTSALYSALNAGDQNHRAALRRWSQLLASDELLLTSNYVLLETVALIQRRMGVPATRDFQTGFVPALDVLWIDRALHEHAVSALLMGGQRDLSLVDCVSFAVMRKLGLDTAFAFDAHYTQQGFRCI